MVKLSFEVVIFRSVYMVHERYILGVRCWADQTPQDTVD